MSEQILTPTPEVTPASPAPAPTPTPAAPTPTPAAPTPSAAAPTPSAAATVDTEAITKAAAEKATEAAEKKMEAVFKSMLQQQGLDAETISKMTAEWKSNQVTPEQELKLRDDTIGTLTQQLEAERQEKVALAKGVPLGSEDEATKAKAAACITLAKSYVSADVTFEAALDKAMGIVSFAPPETEPEAKPPMWGGAGTKPPKSTETDPFLAGFNGK